MHLKNNAKALCCLIRADIMLLGLVRTESTVLKRESSNFFS